MPNGLGSFYIGASGLQNMQNALNTTANNLANVNTTGYVREQVRFSDKSYLKYTNASQTVNMQQSGLGVKISDVIHTRDVFLDKAYRQESGRQAYYETFYDSITEIEDMFQELNGEEFKTSVTDMYVAFQELMKDPSDSTNQNLVIQKAELLVSRANALYSDLQYYQTNLNNQIKADVNRINEIGNRIYSINLDVQKIEVGNLETAMQLRDERDNLLDELATYGSVSVHEDQTGFVTVDFEGISFIDDNCCYNIEMDVAKGTGFVTPYWPQLSNNTVSQKHPVYNLDVEIATEFNNDIGKTKALLMARGDKYGDYTDLQGMDSYQKVRNKAVMETQAELDQLVNDLVMKVNDLLCPNTTLTTDVGPLPAGTVVLDVSRCSVGVDKELPPQELISRMGKDRYTKVTVDGTDYYVYEMPTDDPSTHYTIGNIEVNEELKKQISKFPAYTQNGAVNYELAQDLAKLWEDTDLKLNPEDTYPVGFTKYYDKMISKMATVGSIYHSQAETSESTATSVANQRMQVSGVSSDEELTKMIKYQSAYNAASRFINVINEMTELLVTGLI